MIDKNEIELAELDKAFREVKAPEGMPYQLPPNSFKTLKGEFLGYKSRQQLYTRFWIDKAFSNPQGIVQGGIVAGCFDDTFGPLGVVTSRSAILTIDMQIQYIRQVPLEEWFYIVTNVVSLGHSTIFLRAEAYNQKDKLLAQATSNQLILKYS